MDALVETLDARLRQWKLETAAGVRMRVTEIIGLADKDIHDLLRSRSLEQDVLDILDEPMSRRGLATRPWPDGKNRWVQPVVGFPLVSVNERPPR